MRIIGLHKLASLKNFLKIIFVTLFYNKSETVNHQNCKLYKETKLSMKV
jgi:hypothetical protein